MSTHRDDDALVTGGRAPASTEVPGSRPAAGAGGSVLSTRPESSSAVGSGPRARPPAPAPTGPALRVVLVSRDGMLAGALRSLIEAPGGVRMLDWHSDELDGAIRRADVVVVDMPPSLHRRTFATIDGRFLGRTVVLLQEGEPPEALPPGPPRAILYRPLQIGELWGAVTGVLPSAPTLPDDPEVGEAREAEVEAPEEAASSPGTGTEVPGSHPPDADHGLGSPGAEASTGGAPVVEGPGLPVAESGRLIGLSGQELDPVVGPGQVAPGMDEETLERLRRWGNRSRQPATGGPGAAARKRSAPTGGAEVHREQSRQSRTEARQAARADAARLRAARAEARAAAQEQARQAKATQAAERTATREAARQAKAAKAAEQAAAAEAAREAKKAREAEVAAAREAERQAAAARKAELAEAREAARKARAEDAAARRAERAEARTARRAQAAARRVERLEARRAKAEQTKARRAERVEARRVACEESRRARAARAEVRWAARAAAAQARATQREESKRVRAARAEERRTAREAAAQAKAAAAEVRREEAQRARAARAEAREQARAEAARQRAAREAQRTAARAEAAQVRAAHAEQRRVARAEAAQVRAAEAERRRAARAEARAARKAQAAAHREEARLARAARAEAGKAARDEAVRQRAAHTEARRAARSEARAEAARERAARAAARRGAQEQARAEAAERRKASTEARATAREEVRRARLANAEQRREARAHAERARADRAEARRAERAQARQGAGPQTRREARPETRQATWPEAWQVPRQRTWAGVSNAPDRPRVLQEQARLRAAHRPATLGTTPASARLLAAARPTLVVVAMVAVGLAAAGWRSGAGPDTGAGEVATVRAAGGSEGGLVAQDPRVGPIAPLHALAVGAWLRVTDAGGSLEAVIREARGPSRVVLAGVVGLTMLLFLLLTRVGPGYGAAAGPGPAPPQGRRRGWRLAGAALAGALTALDPLLVRDGRTATATILAVALALGTLALAWGLPARPALRWLPLVGAVGGLALLVSPLALPVLAAPVVAELLEGRHREAWRDMAALGLAVGLWLLLPLWVAGQGLDPGQVGWLLGRPPGRGPLAPSLASEPLSWLLVAAGLAAAFLAWRLRSGARPGARPGARLAAWAATTAAGALAAIALGYPASQALAFAVPAAAVSLAAAGVTVATGAARAPRWVAAVAGVALAGLLLSQGLTWGSRYGQPADDGLGRLVATVATQVPACSAVNAGGPDDRARLLAAGVTVTEYSSGPAAHAAGVRYFALTGATARGGPQTRSLAAWVRQHGSRLADLPSPSLSGIELWRVEAAPLDPMADILPVPGGIFSNVSGSACGGYRVVDSRLGAFHAGYRAVGGKAVLGRPLGTVWTSDGPALQAFDTMILGAAPSAGGPPDVRPIELPPLLAKLDVEAVADADIPLPSARPPVTNRRARALVDNRLIARAYLGASPGSASAEDWRRARERFGRPLGRAQTMPDGAVRQPFERAVLELPADGGPVRPAALGRLAARLGLVPRQAMRPEPVPGLPARPAEVRPDPSPLLRPLGVALALAAAAAAAGTGAGRRRTWWRRDESARTGH
jgi:hypothetical protein